jgi:hypothetical protein
MCLLLRNCTYARAGPVPYVYAALETGTVNRAIYQTVVLHDPLTRIVAELGQPAVELERAAHLHVRRRLHRRVVSPGQPAPAA